LRKIREGENPEAEAMVAPDTPDSVTAAAMVNLKVEMSDQARAHVEAATAKMNSRDGKGCLEELDMHGKLDAKHDSQDPKSAFSQLRAQCLMLAGKCDAGKKLARKAFENSSLTQWGPEQIDKTVEAYGSMYCQGKMGDRDAVLQALMELQKGAFTTKKDVKFCDAHYGTIKRLRNKVKPKDDDDRQIIDLDRGLMTMAPLCYQRAGDCKTAFTVYQEATMRALPEVYGKMDKAQRETSLRTSFDSMVSKCKDK
jgi:hypothetical protein